MSAWINNYKAFGESAFIRTGYNQNYRMVMRSLKLLEYGKNLPAENLLLK